MTKTTNIETAFLSSLINKGGDIQAMNLVRPDDFQDPVRAQIAQLIWTNNHKGKILIEQLENELEKKGLYSAYEEISNYLSRTDLLSLARNVIDNHTKVKLRGLAVDLMKDGNAQDMLSEASNHIRELMSRGAAKGAKPISGIAEEVYADYLKQREAPEDEYLGALTGVEALDRQLQGVESGDLVMILARQSHFKTALKKLMFLYASRNGRKAAFFTLETSGRHLVRRLFAETTKYQIQEIKNARLSSEGIGPIEREEQYRAMDEKMLLAKEEFEKIESHIYDANSSFPVIRAEIYRLYQMGVTEFFIDYFQLMYIDNRRKKHADLLEVAIGLKEVQKDCNNEIRIYLGAQANKLSATEKRTPTADETAGCTDAARVADIILGLSILGKYDEDLPLNKLTISVRKFREGEGGKVECEILSGLRLRPWGEDGFDSFEDGFEDEEANKRALNEDLPF